MSKTIQLGVDEAHRRLPSLDLIEDDELREQTAHLAADAPGYFWSVPASTSGYHNPLCRGDHGLWAHTLMVSTVLERLIDSHVEQGRITYQEADYVRSAAVLHDMRKCGDPNAPVDHTVQDHDLRMASVVYDSGLPNEIGDIVAAHMGPWYEGPEPETAAEQLLHDADMVASTATVTPMVPEPIPNELVKIGVEEAQV